MSHMERFFQKRAEVIRGLSQHIQEITEHAPAGLPAVQAASCLLRECISQRGIHLLRMLGLDTAKEFCKSVDDTVLKAANPRTARMTELVIVHLCGPLVTLEARTVSSCSKVGRHDRKRCTDEGAERCGPEGTGSGGLDQRKRCPFCWFRR